MRDSNHRVERILILGGTAEARTIARNLAHTQPDAIVITSLAGRLTESPELPGTLHIGGFGGLEGLMDFLRLGKITRVIDATHPFAATISAHAGLACAELEIPLEHVNRPMWRKHPGDRWRWADSMEMAARIASRFRRVFLTIGSQELAPFMRYGGPFYLVRMIEAPKRRLGFRDHRLVLGRGPLVVDEELELMRDFAIDLVVTKASGGSATEAKIAAARKLGIPVLLVKRPA
jgi:precorrin-6A/cobalt-precorrin-6A reductase